MYQAHNRNTSSQANRKKAFYSDASTKPEVLRTELDAIPAELKANPRWVAWRLRWSEHKRAWDKIPINPRTGGNAKANTPETWATFDEARAALVRDADLAGLGYQFASDGGEFGIDLDDCRDPATGEIANWAREIIDLFGTYAEVSPSGTGVKLFGRGRLPYARKLADREAYDGGRYFTVTGRPVPGTPPAVADCQAVIDVHYARLFPEKNAKQRTPARGPRAKSADPTFRPTATDVIGKLLGPWKNGPRASRLWGGDTADYDADHSRADAALCAHIAFFAGPDSDLIDAVFRQSGLFRPGKWDEVHSAAGQTYGQMTIAHVLSGTSESYDWRTPHNPHKGKPDQRGGGDDDDDPPPGGEDRPTIVVSPREDLTNQAATVALKRASGLYQRGELLVRVVECPAEKPTDGGLVIARPEGPRLRHHDGHSLRDEVTRIADFVKLVTSKDGDEVAIPVHPPGWCMREVATRKYWPGVPRLTALVGYPVLTPDGRVLTRPGYDTQTGIYLHGDCAGLRVSETPTQEDAREAMRVLLDVVCDFPFIDAAHKAAWVAAVLTPLARFAFTGPSPLFLFEANIRAAGKTLLADMVAAIVTGGEFARAGYTCDKVEMEKVITALAAAGDPMVLFDNVTGRFGDASLDKALTGTSWHGRVLGTSTMFRGPLDTVFFASANNCDVQGDTARRILPSRLEHPDEHPEDKADFKYCLPDWAYQNRPLLLTAALTVLRAYMVAGMPDQKLTAWGSYAGWSRLVRSAVVWAGLDDPVKARDRLRAESDREATSMTQLLAELAKLYPGGKPFTTRDVIKSAGGDEVAKGWEEVADLLTTLEVPTAAKLGYRFRQYLRRNFGGLQLDHPGDGKKGKNGAKWVVVAAGAKCQPPGASSPSSPAAAAGSRGDESSAETGASSPGPVLVATPALPMSSAESRDWSGDDGDDAPGGRESLSALAEAGDDAGVGYREDLG